jgi:hypothetical protein
MGCNGGLPVRFHAQIDGLPVRFHAQIDNLTTGEKL